jgi:hypothetical protein
MSDLPKRVWVWRNEPGNEVVISVPGQPYPTGSPEYIRKDIADAAVKAERTAQQAAQVLLDWYDDLRDPMAVGLAIAQSEEAYLKAMKVAGHKEAASSARARRFLESIARGNAKLIRSLTTPDIRKGDQP